MAMLKAAAKAAAKKGAKGAAKKTASRAAKKKAVPAPKPTTNAVGMRFDMGAGASAGSSAPVNYVPGKVGSTKPARGTPMKPKAAAARVGTGSAAGMVPVAPYKPLLSAKQVRKAGAAGGAVAVTGGMVATAEQKQKSLSRAAKYRR